MTTFRLMVPVGTLAALLLVARLVLAPAENQPVQSAVPDLPNETGAGTGESTLVASLAALRAQLNASHTQQRAMQKELVRLRDDLHELRAEVETKAVAPLGGGVSGLPDEVFPAQAGGEHQDPGERMAAAEADFGDEYLDSTWAYQMNERIRAVFEDPQSGLQTLLTDVECRSASCRVQVTHLDPNDADDFGMVFPASIADDFPEISYHYAEDGSVVMFLSQARQNAQ